MWRQSVVTLQLSKLIRHVHGMLGQHKVVDVPTVQEFPDMQPRPLRAVHGSAESGENRGLLSQLQMARSIHCIRWGLLAEIWCFVYGLGHVRRARVLLGPLVAFKSQQWLILQV